MKVAIIILNWNGYRDTLECLASLKEISYPHLSTLVVDNGSTDGSASIIRERFPEVIVIETGENLGYAGGNNVGITHALSMGSDLILILNNDTIVDKQMLDVFVEEATTSPRVGIFGSWPRRFSDPTLLDHLGGKWNPQVGQFDLIGLGSSILFELREELDYVCGCCILIRREVFQRVGVFEESFFLFWEEADLCMRAKKAGYGIKVCRRATLAHKGSASFSGKAHIGYFWWRNRLLWIKRNCGGKERFRLFWKVLFPEILHLYKLRFFKWLQLKIPSSKTQERRGKLLQYEAAIRGVHDYFRGRFGSGK